VARCSKRTEWGRCAQRADEDHKWCRWHRRFEHRTRLPDRYWHEKLVRGLITPTDSWMSPAELEAVLNGRYRGDGRRIDDYVVGDPLMIDTKGFE
jgi:hypothetical protein